MDKVLLAAGSSAPRFGGGEGVAPFDVYLAGRATHEVDGTMSPVAEIALGSWLWAWHATLPSDAPSVPYAMGFGMDRR